MLRKYSRIIMLLLVAAGGGALWFCLPRHADLRGFDPAAMARIETLSWRHYYEKRWAALALDLYAAARDQYAFSPCASCRLAIHAARAAAVFQRSRDRAEAEEAVPMLEDYFTTIRSESREDFDVTVAAQLELEWWQQRREKKAWPEYGHTVAAATALVYSLAPSALESAALKRAEMMDTRDRKGKAITEEDWRGIEAGLRESWSLCKAAVAR